MRIVVVGGGVSGLGSAACLALEARRRGKSVELLLLEAEPRLGGKIQTEVVDGFLCEWGPEGFLDNSPPTLELCAELGLTPRLTRANPGLAKRRFLLSGGRLQAAPSSPPAFLKSGLLPLRSRLRALLEPLVRKGAAADESVAQFARRRLGRGVADVLVDAMVTGIYGGDPERLSLAGAFPRLRAMEQEHGSLLRGMLALVRQKSKGGGSPLGGALTSFPGGLAELIGALRGVIGEERIRVGRPVHSLLEREGGRLALQLEGEVLEADHVIVTAPPRAARSMVEGLSGELASALEGFSTAAVAVACLGFERGRVAHPLAGFGFLVPGGEGLPLLGCIFSSEIFEGRAPKGHVLLRALLGGARRPELVMESEEAVARRALECLRGPLGLQGEPAFWKVARHAFGIPQYNLGHLERVRALQEKAARWPGLHFSGNAYEGVGINDCIRTATQLARTLLMILLMFLLPAMLASPASAQLLALHDPEARVLQVVQAQGGKVLATGAVDGEPQGWALSSDGLRFWVALAPDPQHSLPRLAAVSSISAQTESARELDGCAGRLRLRRTEASRLFVLCEDSTSMIELSLAEGEEIRRWPVGLGIVDLYDAPEAAWLILLDRSGGLLFYDLEEKAVSRRVPVPGAPQAIEPLSNGTLLLQGDSWLRLFDPEAEILEPELRLDVRIRRVCPLGDGSQILVLTQDQPWLLLLDLEEPSNQRKLELGFLATDIAMHPTGQRAWVADAAGRRMVSLDLEHGAVGEAVALTESPGSLLFLKE